MPIATNDQIAELERQLTQLKIAHWRTEDLFSPLWWLMLATFVIPWFIWWKHVDKTRILKISLFGALILILSSYLDTIGSELALWQYNRMLLPLWSRLIPVDFAVMPVAYMFIYQYFKGWREYIIASLALGFVFAFLAEPLLVWLGIYQLNTWRHLYSFPIYVSMAILVRIIVEKLFRRQNNG